MDTQSEAQAECQLNKADNNIVQVCHESGVLYFRPETEEIIVVPSEEAGDFEAHCLDMLGSVDEFHQANRAYSAAIEKYGVLRAQPGSNPEPQAAEVVAAENKLEAKRAALLKKLNVAASKNMGYQQVVELLPLVDTRKKGAGNQRLGRRYVYASQQYYSERSGGRSQAGAKKKWHSVTLKNNDTATGKDSIYSVDSRGRRTIDKKKLKEQLTKDKLPVLKARLKDYVNLDDYNLEETLFDWADSWNQSLTGSHTFENGVEISGAAQFMRFISNVGAEAEFNPNKVSAKIKAEARASVEVASGICNALFFIPDKLGWDLSYRPGKKEESSDSGQAQPLFNMGVMRIYIEHQLIGFVGASAQVEAQLQVVVKDDSRQIVSGRPQGRLPRFSERQQSGNRQFYQQMDKGDEGAAVSGEAFAGARGEYSLKGALQWLKPTPPPAPGSVVIPKTAGKFTDFAFINSNIAGLAGIGTGAKFHCTFINGKFCFKFAASLCCGVGAKGAFICEVGFKALQEFGFWLVYQLFLLNYHFFDLINEDAFLTYTRGSVIQISDLTKDIYEKYEGFKYEAEAVAVEFDAFITEVADENIKNFKASQRRNKLAKNIIAMPERLLSYTPEAKGILLYLLTRHGKWDHADPGNRGNFLLDIYSERKEAIIQVLYSIQTRREWLKVMCHRSSDGSELAQGKPEQQVIAEQEQELRTFLQEGINRDREMDQKAAALVLAEIYGRLKTERELSPGYALAMNHSCFYNNSRAANPHFPQRCEFGPCEWIITQTA